MDLKLLEKNKLIRKYRPVISKNKTYSIYENNGVLQICFKSRGCSNYHAGSCIMCDYGVGDNLTKEELAIAFDDAIKESKENIKILLLNTFGSILDTNEISEECFNVLLMKLKETNFDRIIFETHCNTITIEKLEIIKKELGDRTISFEMGLESANEKIREENLLKKIDNKRFIETIKLIHSFGMNVIVNLLVGIPFLSLSEQLNDCLSSIDWCFINGVDEVDLFPINVKPYTLLKDLYDKNQYKLISHWLLIEVLNRTAIDNISKIFLAWYGNRELEYENGEISLFPKSCLNCHNDLRKFYKEFLANSDALYRKNLIKSLILNSKCDCYINLLKDIEKVVIL